MKSPSSTPQEVELKLYLPSADPASLAQRLAHTPLLRRRKPARQVLHNIYYDTSDQRLRQQRAVLRLRRVGDDTQPQWLQTFKTGARDNSALSRRGEWESPVDVPTLSRQALESTPWADLDPDGRLFAALKPCFVTVFERTAWLVRRRDGSVVEVALDLGHIEANGQRTPICELELELKAGTTAALFAMAQEITLSVAVLPASMSKAERGFLLAQDGLNQPHHADLPALSAKLPVQLLAQQVLRNMLSQFTRNLDSLRVSDDPEVVHQARIGWRRFKSGLRFFNKVLPLAAPPVSEALRHLLTGLGELRNLDVARTETLPALASAYAMGDSRRAQSWHTLTQALVQASALQRQRVRHTLQQPDVGASLLAITHWLETLPASEPMALTRKASWRHWAKHRILRLQQQLQHVQDAAHTPEQWHRVRILAKRLRYNSEALHDLLPRRLARRCTDQATKLQTSLGAARDITQASVLLDKLELDHGIVEFLRGVAVGADPPLRQESSHAHSENR